MSDTIGRIFRITSFGESHGAGVGILVEGCPAGLPISEADIQPELDRRRPSTAAGGTARSETDRVEILSGVLNGVTTGAPITMMVRNQNTDSTWYDEHRFIPRPGHADYTAFVKYGGFNDHRGGGRFSGRITAGFVMAGALAKKLIWTSGVEIMGHTVEIGGIRSNVRDVLNVRDARNNALGCADLLAAAKMTEAIDEARVAGDSLGGIVECFALGVPVGLGEPEFDTLDGELAKALFAIPAVKGVEFGAGFAVSNMKGSENNDQFAVWNGKVRFATNNSGGVLGGISNGQPLVVRVAVKPTPSISLPQRSVDLRTNEPVDLAIKGRHDACIVPRAVPVVESMVAVTLCDLALRTGLLPRIIR